MARLLYIPTLHTIGSGSRALQQQQQQQEADKRDEEDDPSATRRTRDRRGGLAANLATLLIPYREREREREVKKGGSSGKKCSARQCLYRWGAGGDAEKTFDPRERRTYIDIYSAVLSFFMLMIIDELSYYL